MLIPDQNPSPGMDELLNSLEPMKELTRGQVVEGVVMDVSQDGILVNFGHKSEGLIPTAEMRSLSVEELASIKVGDDILAQVVATESEERAPLLSLDKARTEKGWRLLAHISEVGECVEGRVLGFNRGGAIVEVEGVQGFVPLSQLVSVSRDGFPENESEHKDQMLRLKVMEIDRSRSKAILSERMALQQVREEQRLRLMEELREGEIRKGRVTGISNFGAFVDLGGGEGLIHISELSWNTVSSPDEVVKVGDEVDVYVLKVDQESRRIALSLRRTQPGPWDTITERYQEGQLVSGTVTNLSPFGAFVRLEGSIEGLIHISELSDRLIRHPKEVVKEGDVLTLKILRIEPERRRLGLSLKQAEEEL